LPNQMQGQVEYMEGRVNNGNVEDEYARSCERHYEAKVFRIMPLRIREVANLNNPRSVCQDKEKESALVGFIRRALDNGVISHDQMVELMDAVVIYADDDNRHAVVESSITLAERAINRAIERAAIMSSATGSETIPVVASDNIADEERSFAEERGVSIIRILA